MKNLDRLGYRRYFYGIGVLVDRHHDPRDGRTRAFE